jgi:hypothetical protein
VAAQIGYCGQDRQRRPLRGDEIRACWESLDGLGATPPPPLTAATAWPLEPGTDRTAVRLLEFVEVRAGAAGEARNGDPGVPASDAAGPADATMVASAGEPRWSLWGDAEA